MIVMFRISWVRISLLYPASPDYYANTSNIHSYPFTRVCIRIADRPSREGGLESIRKLQSGTDLRCPSGAEAQADWEHLQ